MDKKIRNRKWNITKVSKSIPVFELLDVWKNFIIKEVKLRKNSCKSLANFKKWYFTLLKALEYDRKIKVVAQIFSEEKNKTDEQKDWLHEKNRIWSDLEVLFEDEELPNVYKMVKANEKKVRNYLKDAELAKYKTKIEIDFFQNSNHMLNGENEFAYDQIGGISALMEIYDALNEDVEYEKIYDSHGKLVEDGTWFQALTCDDEEIRKNTYISSYSMKLKHRQTLKAIMTCMFIRRNQTALLQKYKNEIECNAREFYNILFKDYLYIIDECVKLAPCYKKWNDQHNKLIKEAYGLSSIEPWNSELEIKNIFEEVTEAEAKKLLLDSLQSFGDDYVNRIKDTFSKNIIKWDKTTKTYTNGYCITENMLDESPISFNWNGTVRSVLTLSHELGHNLKNEYCKSNNEVNISTDTINVEISSIITEFVTIFYLIDKYKKEKKNNFLYGAYYELFRYFFHCTSHSLIYLQFNSRFVNHCLKRKETKPEIIEKMFIQTRAMCLNMTKSEVKKSLTKWPYNLLSLDGYSMFIDYESNSWNMLGYMIGCIIGIVIAWKIYHGDKKALNDYFNFLKKGNDIRPLNVTSELGVDILKPQIYTEAKQLINDLLNQFIKDIEIDVKKDPKE